MAAYHQVDDEVLIRSPNGSVLCHTTGSRRGHLRGEKSVHRRFPSPVIDNI